MDSPATVPANNPPAATSIRPSLRVMVISV
jgi:hypothetical protein